MAIGVTYDFEAERIVSEREREGRWCDGGAVLDGEQEFIAAPSQIEIGIPPGMKI